MLLTIIFSFQHQFGEKNFDDSIFNAIKNLIEINKLTLRSFKLVI